MIRANSGMNGPWAPLGILYYIPIYISSWVFGASLLSIRVGSAIVSVATVALAYIMLRRFSSTVAAVTGSSLLAVESLQIGWGRTDVHPHGSTTWPAMLICLVTFLFLEKRTWHWLPVVVLLMALSWHQYPSGQTAFLIPVLVLIFSFCKGQLDRPQQRKMLLAVCVGCLLWALGGPFWAFIQEGRFSLLSYFSELGPRVYSLGQGEGLSLSARALSIGENALKHLWDLIQGIYFQAPYLHHQDIMMDIPSVPTRAINWFAAVFATLYLVWGIRRPGSRHFSVMVAWLLVAPLPAILSDNAFPKRASALYPALCCMAGLSLSQVFALLRKEGFHRLRILFSFLLGVSFVAWVCLTSYQWFSGERVQMGIAVDVELAQKIQDKIQPRSIIVFRVDNHYYEGKLVYLLIDKLQSSQPLVWYNYRTEDLPFSEILRDPERVVPLVMKGPYQYSWTPLDSTIAALSDVHDWNRLVVIIERRSSSREALDEIRSIYPEAERIEFGSARCGSCTFDIFVADIKPTRRPSL